MQSGRGKTLISMAMLAACGRTGFDAIPDGSALSAPVLDAAPAPIIYVGPFVHLDNEPPSPTISFPAKATAAGNAIVMQVSCTTNTLPTAVAVTAPGWSFTQLGGITSSTQGRQLSATFVAIAPDPNAATVTVSWSSGPCTDSNQLGDEFAMTDPTGGSLTFDGFTATQGSGNCTATLTTAHAGDAVWAACNTANEGVTAIGAGFTKGADDGVHDWTEYALTNQPAGTTVTAEFADTDIGHVMSMVTLKPR